MIRERDVVTDQSGRVMLLALKVEEGGHKVGNTGECL